MSWTQVTILIEGVKDEKFDIAKIIFKEDIHLFLPNENYFSRFKSMDTKNDVVFITYERRKHLPYWVIQEVSNVYKNAHFTVIANSPEYDGGPAGIVKIQKGQIKDSYGFWGKRQETLINPEPELIFEWFKKNGYEEFYRDKRILIQPKKWIDELYHKNIIDFDDSEEAELEILKNLVYSKLNEEWFKFDI